MALRALSLCSGIGGLDLGLRALGVECVCYVEREAFSAAVLVARMADASLDRAPVWSDVATFDARAWRGRVDLLHAGYPCQPFSCAGKRRGKDDVRHLWPDVRRAIEEARPSVVVLENVRGHLRLGAREVLADLAALGLDAEWGVFRARDVGAPHDRARLFVLAWALSDAGRDAVRLLAERGEQVEAERRDALAGGVGAGLWRGLADAVRERRGLAGSARPEGPEWRPVADVVEPGEGRKLADATRERGVGEGQHERPGPGDVAPDALGGRGGPRPLLWPPGPKDAGGWFRVLERRPDLAPALPRVRGVAHGVPGRMDRLRALGNAVVPAQATYAVGALARRAVAGGF